MQICKYIAWSAAFTGVFCEAASSLARICCDTDSTGERTMH